MSEKKFFKDGVLKETSDGPVLVGNTCAACGRVHFPKVEFCPHCYSQELTDRELSREGILHAYTVTRVPLDHFDPPHALGIVLLPGDKLSVLTPLALDEDQEVALGTPMELRVAPLWVEADGSEIWGYKIAPSLERES